MSILTRSLDPALLEVLKDLEQRDTQALFVTSPTRLVRGLRDGSAVLRAGRMRQSAALDELLRVHREELAFLLFTEGRKELLEKPSGNYKVYSRFDPSSSGQLMTTPQVSTGGDAQALARSLGTDCEIDLILGALGADGPDRCSQLLAASLRVAPRNSSRINWALGLDRNGQRQTALRVLRITEESTNSRFHASCAAQDLGIITWMSGDLSGALGHFRRADDPEDETCASAAYALALAWILGEEQVADALCRSLREKLPHRPQDLERVEADLSRLSSNRNLVWSVAESDHTSKRIEDEFIARIARALHRHEID